MTISIDIHSLIFIIVATQGIALSFFLFFRQDKDQLENRILALLVGVFSINLLVRELTRNFYETLPHLIASADSLLFLYGPLIFFYTKLIIKEKVSVSKKDITHLIPFLVCILLFFPFYIKSGEAKLLEVSSKVPILFYIIWISACIHIAAYMLSSVAAINEYRFKIKQRFSNIEKIDFKWLQYILIVNFIIWLFDAFVITNNLFGIQIEAFVRIDQFMGYILSLFIYFLGYRALVKHEYSIKVNVGSELQLVKSTNAKKYQRSGLTLKKAEEYKNELLEFMDDESPYLNPDIAMADLSDTLSIPSNHLSQVINQKFDKNFFDFINSYRVEEAKEWLSDPVRSKETMLMIAFESGFKSKSTFNAAFKKLTGITPSQFKKGYYGDKSDKSVS